MSSYDSFKNSFKGDIVIPSDPTYQDSLKRWAANSSRPAKIVAFVKDAEDAAAAIKFAAQEKLPIAIRGGGHSFSGTSSSTDGLVIDLSRYINGVRIDPENKLGYVGGGATWEAVDVAAIKHGLAAVGGTVNHTGVGGLTLGGGYGWLSGAHGLAIDNLVQATLVLASGEIVTASDKENSDLFWAIRGGGCNFGVCTEFVFRLHDQRPTVYSGVLIYPPPLFDALVEVTDKWWNEKNASTKEGMFQTYARGGPNHDPVIVAIPFYNGSEAEGRENFKAFLDLHPIDMTSEMPYEKLNGLQNENLSHGQCVYMRGVLQTNLDLEVQKAVFNRFAELSDPQWRLVVLHEFVPLAKINSVPDDAAAFNTRTTKRNVMGACFWDVNTPENQARGRELVNAVTDIIAQAEKNAVDATERAYANYEGDNVDTSDRARSLFGSNYPRLQQVKKRYDPNLLFSKWFPIRPQ